MIALFKGIDICLLSDVSHAVSRLSDPSVGTDFSWCTENVELGAVSRNVLSFDERVHSLVEDLVCVIMALYRQVGQRRGPYVAGISGLGELDVVILSVC